VSRGAGLCLPATVGLTSITVPVQSDIRMCIAWSTPKLHYLDTGEILGSKDDVRDMG
jgi:hypothetical protein